MGFFKNIGKGIKKGLKQVSFKNLVKVGSMVDPTGLVGGMQEAHYAKKEAQAQEAQGNAQMADYYNQQAQVKSAQAGANLASYVTTRSNVQSALNGAIGQAGADVVDMTFMATLKRHWQKVAIAVGGLVVLVLVLRRGGNKSRR